MSLATLWALPAWSAAPRRQEKLMAALRENGVVAVHGSHVSAFTAAGFRASGFASINTPEEADAIAQAHKGNGFDLVTLHVGSGLETDTEMDALAGAVIKASVDHKIPMLVETHRATMTQDIRRTVDLAARFPDLRFTADLAHWYTGLEMCYGDFEARLRFLAPIFERVRYVQGRFADPGCIQRSPQNAGGEPFVEHIRHMWRLCFEGFLKTAAPGEVLPFAPELLPYCVDEGNDAGKQFVFYARQIEHNGVWREESDRWTDALAILRFAREDFETVRMQWTPSVSDARESA
jgi:hypothetical protein